jgi:hypothetical protein
VGDGNLAEACAQSRETHGGGTRLDGRPAAGAHVWMGGRWGERASGGEPDGGCASRGKDGGRRSTSIFARGDEWGGQVGVGSSWVPFSLIPTGTFLF